MGSMNKNGPIGAHLLAVAAFFLGGSSPARAADDEPGKALVGAWEKDGKVTVISADGTGKNHDGSRFRWELKGGRLIARSRAGDGKLGEEWSVPIAFTRDEKEYSYLLGGEDGGLKRMTYSKLDPQGRRYAGRTEADRAYPPDAEALEGEGPPQGDGDRPAPSVVPQ
ncbi:hypothetical protein SAMN05444166_7608 [Singulisphaera sp. GP187]|uniref:hypothetical protein n=1 Tax=Singulisphaera sp. GP187 TaxID=1882752 RepID=UPI0009293999|nr:hypothetical protein [Singulisphaera sp. GP187]SIO65155.1 hypothetical protein SAMN05444166_7608 [Singulisphaera sp. GP187]